MKVIINADDFGLSVDCTDAITEAFEKRCISQTTMLVNGPDVERAISIAHAKGFEGRIGLHLNLVEGVPLTDRIKQCPLFCSEGKFSQRVNLARKSAGSRFEESVRQALIEEVEAQIQRFCDCKGFLKHCDSHQHTLLRHDVAKIVFPILKKYGFLSVRTKPMWRFRLGGLAAVNLRMMIGYGLKPILYRYMMRLNDLRGAEEFMPLIHFKDHYKELKRCNVVEVMVHPRYFNGSLVDTQDWSNDDGVDLVSVVGKLEKVELVSYGEAFGF